MPTLTGCSLFAVAHNQFKSISLNDLNDMFNKKPIVIDLKSVCGEDIQDIENYWSL